MERTQTPLGFIVLKLQGRKSETVFNPDSIANVLIAYQRLLSKGQLVRW